MRVYLPATTAQVAVLYHQGGLSSHDLVGWAVTPGLREAYASGDTEELEYVASSLAARACLRLLESDPAAPRRRVVLALELAPGEVEADPAGAGRVRLTSGVPLACVAAVLADDARATPAVAAAVGALPAAAAGDPDAGFLVDACAEHELCWWATQEVPDLLTDLLTDAAAGPAPGTPGSGTAG